MLCWPYSTVLIILLFLITRKMLRPELFLVSSPYRTDIKNTGKHSLFRRVSSTSKLLRDPTRNPQACRVLQLTNEVALIRNLLHLLYRRLNGSFFRKSSSNAPRIGTADRHGPEIDRWGWLFLISDSSLNKRDGKRDISNRRTTAPYSVAPTADHIIQIPLGCQPTIRPKLLIS